MVSKWVLLMMVLIPSMAFAYIGPGMGAGAIASVLGVIGSVFLVLFAILYYPIKRMIKKKRKSESEDGVEASDETIIK